MEPTTTQLTNRTRALANLNAGLPKNLNIQTPEVISAEDIKKENTALVIPDTPPESNPLAGLDAQINSLLSAASPEETQQNKLQESILSRMEALSGERARQQELEQQAGLPGQRQELQNIVNQLRGLQKEAAAIPLQIQQEAEGRGITAGGAAPIQAGRLRENAIKSLGLAAIGQTLQGNISLAQQSIQDALDAEFEPERQQLQILSQLYQFNKDALERVDKQRADRLGIFINERNRILQNERDDREFTSSLMLQAVKSGMTVAQAEEMARMTPEGAIAFAAEYFGEDFKRQAEQQAFENGIRTREVALKEAQFALEKRMSLFEFAKSGNQGAIDELGYDPRDVEPSEEELLSYENQRISIEKDIKDIQAALDNTAGLAASTGLIRGNLATFTSGLGGGVAGGGAGLIGGPVVAVGGLVTGATASAAYTTQKRNSFMGTARYVVNNLTLKKVGDLSEQGIKLTPVSNEELRLMGRASARLAALGDFDESGQLIGFSGSDEEVRAEMEAVLRHYERALSEINRATLISSDEDKEIENTK